MGMLRIGTSFVVENTVGMIRVCTPLFDHCDVDVYKEQQLRSMNVWLTGLGSMKPFVGSIVHVRLFDRPTFPRCC